MRFRCSSTGFTITEALVTLLVFSFFIGILFVTLAHGFRTFSLSVARSDVTTEARRLLLYMESELRSTAYFSIAPVERMSDGPSLQHSRRDGLCFVSVLDWSKPNVYNRIEARPEWDRYVCYYATTEEPSGRLVRLALSPEKSEEVGSFPYAKFGSVPFTYMVENPLALKLSDLANVRVIATKIKSFEVELLPAGQEVDVRTILRQNAIMSRRGDKRREGGTFELHYRIRPQNSK